MAIINIPFDNTNYPIDEASLSAAQAALRTHLSSVMNGSGATINFGGVPYSIDSAKLTAATNDFVSHLGTVAGNGYKVMVGGVEYTVDATKMAGAVADLHTVLGGLQSGGEGGTTENVVLAEKAYAFVHSDGNIYISSPTVDNNLISFDLTVGESYKIIWNGAEYVCVAGEMQGMPYIGNTSIYGVGNNTGEPFLVGINSGMPMLITTGEFGDATQITVGIYSTTATLIFDAVMTQATAQDGSYEEFAIYEDSSNTTLIIGNTYKYEHFGKTYTSVCFESQGAPCIGNTVPITGVDNGQPCVIVRDVTGAMFDGTPVWMCVTLPSGVPDDFDGQIPVKIYDLGRPTTVLAERTYNGFTYNSIYGAYSYDVAPAPFQLNIGERYRIVWDGVSYECRGQDLSALVDGAVGVGNLANFGGHGNGEPFVIGWTAQGVSFYAFDASASHNVAIYRILSEVPVGTVILEEKSYDNFVDFGEAAGADAIGVYYREAEAASGLFVGEVYKVVFDGEEYIVQAKIFNDSSDKPVYIGNIRTFYGSTDYVDTKEPFLIYDGGIAANNMNVAIMTKETGTSHLVGIYKA